MKTDFLIGQDVIKILPKNDYTSGRKGTIVDIGFRSERVRVRWMYESDGSLINTCNSKPGNGVRTWVNIRSINHIK